MPGPLAAGDGYTLVVEWERYTVEVRARELHHPAQGMSWRRPKT